VRDHRKQEDGGDEYELLKRSVQLALVEVGSRVEVSILGGGSAPAVDENPWAAKAAEAFRTEGLGPTALLIAD
jgi:hypothetical protein